MTTNECQQITTAIEIATAAHRHDVDKSGLPYIYHPLRVMLAVRELLPNDVDAICAAVLHDVKEDHPNYWEEKALFLIINQRTGILVDALSRKGEETYQQFIDRVCTVKDTAALIIKICDVEDNLSRPTPTELFNHQLRYDKAREQLNHELIGRKTTNLKLG